MSDILKQLDNCLQNNLGRGEYLWAFITAGFFYVLYWILIITLTVLNVRETSMFAYLIPEVGLFIVVFTLYGYGFSKYSILKKRIVLKKGKIIAEMKQIVRNNPTICDSVIQELQSKKSTWNWAPTLISILALANGLLFAFLQNKLSLLSVVICSLALAMLLPVIFFTDDDFKTVMGFKNIHNENLLLPLIYDLKNDLA